MLVATIRSKRSSSASGASRSSTMFRSRTSREDTTSGRMRTTRTSTTRWRRERWRRFFTDAAAERLPEPDQIGMPSAIAIARQHDHIRFACIRASARGLKMTVDSCAQVERCQTEIVRSRQAKPAQRVDHGERLSNLRWIEVVAFGLVGEVEARPNDADAAHRRGLDQPHRRKSLERPIDCEVRPDRCVRGEAASAVETRSDRELGTVRRRSHRLNLATVAIDLAGHAREKVAEDRSAPVLDQLRSLDRYLVARRPHERTGVARSHPVRQ